MKYTKLTNECCIEQPKYYIECELLLFIQRPFIDHLRMENGIKTQRQIKKQSFHGIKEMAIFRCFECILYFFICFVISRSAVRVRPVAPNAVRYLAEPRFLWYAYRILIFVVSE